MTAGEVYCHHNMSCISENATCDGTVDNTHSTLCASGHVWSFSQRKCVDSSGNDKNTNQMLDAGKLWCYDHVKLRHDQSLACYPNIIFCGSCLKIRIFTTTIYNTKQMLEAGKLWY